MQLQRWLAPLADPKVNDESNLLLIVDFGRGPLKVARADGTFVGIGPAPRQEGPIPQPVVIVDGEPLPTEGLSRPPLDLLALGQDRRWQSIDTIRTIKSVVGTGLIGAGVIDAATDRHGGHTAMDLALIGAGILLKATSQADTRSWETLPRSIFVLPLHLPPGKHDVTVRFQGVHGLAQTWHDLIAPTEGEATYYMHMQPLNSGPFIWPPAPLVPPPASR